MILTDRPVSTYLPDGKRVLTGRQVGIRGRYHRGMVVTRPDPQRSPGGGPTDGEDPTTSTRQRILDTAIELFTEQGYDGTSLREIAERVGVTKAALYYHFASKSEIVTALWEPFTTVQRDWLASFSTDPDDEAWADALGEVTDWMVDNQRLFQLFERNLEVFEALHAHGADHQQMHERIDAVIGNPANDDRRRIRMAAAIGVAMSMSPMGSQEALEGIDPEVVRDELRAAVRRVLGI